jgi:hypothetical protein
MKTINKKYNQNMEIQPHTGRWLKLLLLWINHQWVRLALSKPTTNQGNAPPFVRRWYGCKYGLWRLNTKPIPIRTTRFRRN